MTQGRRPIWIWLAAAALGAAGALLAALIGVLGFFFVLLIIPGLSRQTWLAATSGALTGFGLAWLASVLRAPEPGGPASDGTLALVVGVVPFALGLVLGLMAIASARRGAV